MKVIDSFRLYIKYAGMSFSQQLQYRASFIMMTAGYFLVCVIEFFGIWVLFSRFGSLKGWTLAEVAVFYGMINSAFAIALGVGRGFDAFAMQVRSGDFDRLLLRPRTTFLQVLGLDFQLLRFGRLTQGVVVLAWGIAHIAVAWTAAKAALLGVAVLGGVMFFMGLLVVQATMCFWSTQSLEVMNCLTDGGVETAQWPISIFGNWFVKLFIFVIPLACVNYFPVVTVLGRADPLHAPAWAGWISPAAGPAFLAASLAIWEFGVRHYRSTGS